MTPPSVQKKRKRKIIAPPPPKLSVSSLKRKSKGKHYLYQIKVPESQNAKPLVNSCNSAATTSITTTTTRTSNNNSNNINGFDNGAINATDLLEYNNNNKNIDDDVKPNVSARPTINNMLQWNNANDEVISVQFGSIIKTGSICFLYLARYLLLSLRGKIHSNFTKSR